MDPVGRMEGMGKALWQTGKKSAEFFIDIGQEVVGMDDEFEGDDILSAIWGSWKDNVLGEQGVVQSLFGIDTKDKETGEYGGGFGGLLFGSIPEEVRQAGNKIITPTFELLDGVYDYAVDRPVGTFLTIAGSGWKDPTALVDPTDWVKAWNITNSRSAGQAFALAFTGADWTIKNVEERYEGSAWFNLTSGLLDGLGNIVLDPANLIAPAKLRKFQTIAQRTIRSTDYLAQTGVESKKYLRWKTQVQNIGQLEEFAGTSDRFKNGLGFEPNSQDGDLITLLGYKILQAANDGKLGSKVKNMEDYQARQLAAVINNDAAFDMLIRLWAGDATVLPEMVAKANDFLNEKTTGGLIDTIDKLNQPAQRMPIVGPDGLPLDVLQRDVALRNSAGVDQILYGADGRPLVAGATVANPGKIQMFDWHGQAVDDLWAEAFGVVLDDKTFGGLDIFAQNQVRESATRTGFWFNKKSAKEIDPLGHGGYRWIPTRGATGHFIRRIWDDLPESDQEGLLNWAGIHPKDKQAKQEFIDKWNDLIRTDKEMDDAVGSMRRHQRNEAGGTVTPRTGEGLTKAQQQLRENREAQQLAGEERKFVEDLGIGREPSKAAAGAAFDLLSQDRRAAIIQAMDAALYWSARFGKPINLHDLTGITYEGFVLQTVRGSMRGKGRGPQMGIGSSQPNTGRQYRSHGIEEYGYILGPDGRPVRTFQPQLETERRVEGVFPGGDDYRPTNVEGVPISGPHAEGAPPVPFAYGERVRPFLDPDQMDFQYLSPKGIEDYWDFLAAKATVFRKMDTPKGFIKTGADGEVVRGGASPRELNDQVRNMSVRQRRDILRGIVDDKRLTRFVGTPWRDIPRDMQNLILRKFEEAHEVRRTDVAINVPIRGRKVPMYAPTETTNRNLPYWATNRRKLTSEMGPDDPFDLWWMAFILEIEATRGVKPEQFRTRFWESLSETGDLNDTPERITGLIENRVQWKDVSKADRRWINNYRRKVTAVSAESTPEGLLYDLTPSKVSKAKASKEFAQEWDGYVEFESDWDWMLTNSEGQIPTEFGMISEAGMHNRNVAVAGLTDNANQARMLIRAGILAKIAGKRVDEGLVPDQAQLAAQMDLADLDVAIGQRAEAVADYRRELHSGPHEVGRQLDPMTGVPLIKGNWIQGPKQTRYVKRPQREITHVNPETGLITRRTFHIREWADSKKKDVVIEGGSPVSALPKDFAEYAHFEEYGASPMLGSLGDEVTVVSLDEFEDWAKAHNWEIRDTSVWEDINTRMILSDEEMRIAMRNNSSSYREMTPSELATARETVRRHEMRGLVIDEIPDDELMALQNQLFADLMQGEYVGFPYAAVLSMEELKLRSMARRRDISVQRADEAIDALEDGLNKDEALVMAAATEIMENVHPGILSEVPTMSRKEVWMTEFWQDAVDSKFFPNRVVRLFSEKVPQGIIYWDNIQHAYEQMDRMLRDASRVTNEWSLTRKGKSKKTSAEWDADHKISLTEYAGVDVDVVMANFAAATSTKMKQQLFHETVEKLNNALPRLFEGRIGHHGQGPFDPNNLTHVLRRNHRRAERKLQEMGRNGRVYGNGQLMVPYAEEGGIINVRAFENLTPQQLAQANLVPRYDLFEQAFTDLSPAAKAARSVKDAVGYTSNAFTTVWKRSVLLRPAWPMRVITDELARNAAEVGAVHALRGFIHGFGNLQAGWYKAKGVELNPLVMEALIKDLGKDYKIAGKYDVSRASFPELVEAISTKYGDDHTKIQKIVKDVIVEVHRKKGLTPLGRTTGRAMGASAIAAFVAGPVGAVAAGGIHVLHSRRSLRRLAELETANTMGYTLSNMATGRMRDRIAELEGNIARSASTDSWFKGKITKGTPEYEKAMKEIQTLRDAKRVLETQGSQLLEQWTLAERRGKKQIMKDLQRKRALEVENVLDEMAVYEQEDLAQNFDTVGKIMADAGVSDYHMGGIRVGNEFGNVPQSVQMWQNAMSADSYNRNLWSTTSQAQRRSIRAANHQSYDYSSGKPFVQAWNDTVNRQWIPLGDAEAYARPTKYTDNPLDNLADRKADAKWWRDQSGISLDEGNPYQDFTRLFWLEDVTDDDILRWLKRGPGRTLEVHMPSRFAQDETSLRQWIKEVRFETDSLIPNLPEFRLVRRQVAKGDEVNWMRDIQPIINREFKGDITNLRQAVYEAGFDSYDTVGRVIGDGKFAEAEETHRLVVRMQRRIDDMFTNIGTLPTDTLTRSVVFNTVYQREIAQRVQALGSPDTGFIIDQKRLNAIEGEARRIALKQTKNLLYDLAERTRFEEIMANIMPFFAAYQEVITRWAGIAVRNPDFVLTAARNFRKAIEGDIWPGDGFIVQTDAEGNPIIDEETGEPKLWLDENGEPEKLALIRIPSEIFGLDVDEKLPDWLPVFGGDGVFGKMGALKDHQIKVNLGSMAMISGGMPGFGPIFGATASEIRLAMPELEETMSKFFPGGIAEGASMWTRLIDSTLPRAGTVLASQLFDTNESARIYARHAGDVIAEWTLNNQVWDSETAMMEWNDEVRRRAEAHLQVRFISALAVPFSMMVQSPYQQAITEYQKMKEEYGLEAADEHLIRHHPYLWGQLGRQTRVEGVAAATLKGHRLYEANKKFIDDHPEIQDFLLGKLGTLDVQYEFNRAVYQKEINEGRRVYQTPEEILRRAQGTIGWYHFQTYMAPVNEALDQQRRLGLPVSLNADYNQHLLAKKQLIIQLVGDHYPLWLEDYNDVSSIGKNALVVNEFRDFIQSDLETHQGRPEMPHIVMYLQERDDIALEMLSRSQHSGDIDMQTLAHPQNQDLRDRWENLRVVFALIPDFQEVYLRYFDNDDIITRDSWPSSIRHLAHQQLLSSVA